jgi:hypothetical protein
MPGPPGPAGPGDGQQARRRLGEMSGGPGPKRRAASAQRLACRRRGGHPRSAKWDTVTAGGRGPDSESLHVGLGASGPGPGSDSPGTGTAWHRRAGPAHHGPSRCRRAIRVIPAAIAWPHASRVAHSVTRNAAAESSWHGGAAAPTAARSQYYGGSAGPGDRGLFSAGQFSEARTK